LNALFTKEADEIEPKRQGWSKWTVDQCRRGANTMVDDGNGNLVRACVKGGKIGGKNSIEKKRKSPARDANYKMANGDAPENDLQQFASERGKIGGRTDAKPETKKAKKFHPNPENEDGFNSKWEEHGQSGSLQRQQALEQTGTEHMVQHMEEQLKQGPAGGFLEGLGARRFEGYKLGYTGGWNTDADKDAVEQATTQPDVVDIKSRFKKKRAVAKALNIPTAPTGHIYKSGAFKKLFDELFPLVSLRRLPNRQLLHSSAWGGAEGRAPVGGRGGGAGR
jgi:hypothetical protein